MKVYFPIPPNITVEGLKDKIYGSITFLNIPNNRLKPFLSRNLYRDIVFLGIYQLKNKCWSLITVKKCLPFEFLEISRNEFNVKDHEIIVAVVKKSNFFENQSRTLTEPDSLKIDNSIVAQRVSLNFSFLNLTSSFQGEYPFGMASLNKSSFLSFDTLKGVDNEKQKSYLILMNISKNYNSTETIEVRVFDPNNKYNYRLLEARRNSFSVYPTVEYEKEFEQKETIFFSSNKCSFIPIILSINLRNRLLSLEHIHPPTEYFFGSRKKELVKFTKTQWLN